MSIEKTKNVLTQILDARAEALEGDMSEVPMIAIPAETAQAIKNAIVALESFRIIEGIFADRAEV